MLILICIILAIFGATLGSFSVAQVWRIRAYQLKEEIADGELANKTEWKKLKPLTTSNFTKDRSHCLSCESQLEWFDLIPIFSWISLKGKCRKCHEKIGCTEILAEIGLAAIFVLSFIFWPNGILNTTSAVDFASLAQFSLWAIILVFLAILFIYDAKWSLLPMKTMIIFIILASCFWLVNVLLSDLNLFSEVINLGISMLILPGVYLALTTISKGEWVGSGDWILSVGLVLLLPNIPILTVLVLFLSNTFGVFTMTLSSIFTRKSIKRGSRMPFGPLLIIATIAVFMLYPQILNFLKFFS